MPSSCNGNINKNIGWRISSIIFKCNNPSDRFISYTSKIRKAEKFHN